jgi:hypothetical protein
MRRKRKFKRLIRKGSASADRAILGVDLLKENHQLSCDWLSPKSREVWGVVACNVSTLLCLCGGSGSSGAPTKNAGLEQSRQRTRALDSWIQSLEALDRLEISVCRDQR